MVAPRYHSAARRSTDPTPREIDVLVATVELSTLEAAAHRLGISRSTARWHLGTLYARIGATNRPHAVALLWPRISRRVRLPAGHLPEPRCRD